MISAREIRDIQQLMRWREEVLVHVFHLRPDPTLLAANRDYYSRHIADGSHFAVVADCDGDECGCGAICFSEELPSPDNNSGRCAYLMNIYVREPFRNRGIAHAIVRRLLEEAAKRACGKIYLETTAAAKPVYSSIGFKEMPDMMKYYDKEN